MATANFIGSGVDLVHSEGGDEENDDGHETAPFFVGIVEAEV